MSLTRYFVFFAVVTGIAGLIHTYLWWRIVHAPAWPAPWQRVGAWAFIVLAASVPMSFVASRLLPKPIGLPFIWIGYVWMGLMFLLLVLTLLGEPVRIVDAVLSWVAPNIMSAERRQFLLRAVAGVTTVGAGGLAAFGVYSAIGKTRVHRVPVQVLRAPAALRGLKVAQITDIHIGPTLGRDFLEGIVERVNSVEPDVIAITGDLVDGSVAELGHAVRALEGLRAKQGVYFVTGNHEYYSGADEWIRFLGTLGVRVLRNERIALEHGGEGFDLVGIDDWSSRGFGGDHGANLPKALAGRDAARPSILLAHQPKAFPEAASLGIDLQISGHTHGGQIKPFNLLTKLDTPYVRGLYREGQSQIYVSPGTGYWGPPMRVGVPPEVTLLEFG